MSNIGARIAERRKEIGLTQEELANRLGYKSRSTINKIELGVNDITQTKVVEFANALHTTVSYLMGWAENEPREVDGVLENGVLDVMQAYIALPTEQKNMIRRMLGLSEIR